MALGFQSNAFQQDGFQAGISVSTSLSAVQATGEAAALSAIGAFVQLQAVSGQAEAASVQASGGSSVSLSAVSAQGAVAQATAHGSATATASAVQGASEAANLGAVGSARALASAVQVQGSVSLAAGGSATTELTAVAGASSTPGVSASAGATAQAQPVQSPALLGGVGVRRQLKFLIDEVAVPNPGGQLAPVSWSDAPMTRNYPFLSRTLEYIDPTPTARSFWFLPANTPFTGTLVGFGQFVSPQLAPQSLAAGTWNFQLTLDPGRGITEDHPTFIPTKVGIWTYRPSDQTSTQIFWGDPLFGWNTNDPGYGYSGAWQYWASVDTVPVETQLGDVFVIELFGVITQPANEGARDVEVQWDILSFVEPPYDAPFVYATEINAVQGSASFGQLTATGGATALLQAVQATSEAAPLAVQADASVALGAIEGASAAAQVEAHGYATTAADAIQGTGEAAPLFTSADASTSLDAVQGAASVENVEAHGYANALANAVQVTLTAAQVQAIGASAYIPMPAYTLVGTAAQVEAHGYANTAIGAVEASGTNAGNRTQDDFPKFPVLQATGEAAALVATGDAAVALSAVQGYAGLDGLEAHGYATTALQAVLARSGLNPPRFWVINPPRTPKITDATSTPVAAGRSAASRAWAMTVPNVLPAGIAERPMPGTRTEAKKSAVRVEDE